MTKRNQAYYNVTRPLRGHACGGIAQLARACGSYPQCRWFNANCRYHNTDFSPDKSSKSPYFIWRVGQAVKTRPFHGCNRGSIPLRVTRFALGWLFRLAYADLLSFGRIAQLVRAPASHAGGQRFESVCVHQKGHVPFGMWPFFISFCRFYAGSSFFGYGRVGGIGSKPCKAINGIRRAFRRPAANRRAIFLLKAGVYACPLFQTS